MKAKSEIKLILIFISLFSSGYSFSQKEMEYELFDSVISEKARVYKSNALFYKSTSFFLNKDWDSTLVYTMKQLNNPQKNREVKNYSHFLRGCSFNQKKLYKEAQKEFKLISPDFEFYFIVKMDLGEVALQLSQFKKAIAYYEELLSLSDNNYKYLKKSIINHNLGLCYLHLGEFKKAEPYLIENVKLEEQKEDTLKIILAYGNLANLYYEQYQDDLAIPYFEKAYQLSKKIKDIKTKHNSALNMAVVEENRKNFQKSLAYRKEYEQWKDSLNDQNKIWEVAQLEKQFAVKEKQKEVSLLQVENKAKIVERNGLFYSAIVLLVLLGTTMYFYKEKIKTNKIIVAQKERLDVLNATKDKLFSIVSHDLRSSVNALKTSNTKLLDNLEAKNLDVLDNLLHTNSAIVNGAYNLLDNLLNWALLQTNQSYFEITSIRLFFIVEQTVYNYKPLMLEKNIDFETKILKKDVVFADQESLKIILRNLLDNAIKFSNENGKIKIYTTHTHESYCDLVIEDSGLGISKTARLELLKDSAILSKKEHEDVIGTGLGLQLCKSMIKKNNGKFSIESELGKGTKMIVSLPKTAS
ncbi:tetratricopeptide repeat-containing sensor histidine kinase [Mariniflexile litorale]|uniref:histidine kinase n=1 Tax=Mariniflexile litorale TaxID=3045158 RepID=A0AAU7EGK3_9FLAO|nr:tetratricopeptide repeat-containing sensor histidine kinase [Mariniflexile sp. KMM 9835]MDQ8210232.1 tetratricopeptide repeat-containing sensor histidine kinase [Mariniflexile sp. KMM 9835]